MNHFIKPVDPLVQDNNDLFHADEKMHYILENKDIQDYLDYIKEKHNFNKSKINPKIKPDIKSDIKPDIKPDYSYNNKYKKQMLENIWSNILILENTIKKFKF
jgi:hypothetical protein